MFSDNLLDGRQTFVENTKRVWLLEVDTARTRRLLKRLQIQGSILVVSQHTNVNFRTLAIVVHDRQFVGRREG